MAFLLVLMEDNANMDQLDQIDRAIIRELQGDGRLPNVDLANRVGLSQTACLRRLKKLEGSGVIKRYGCVIDQTQVGLPVSVFVSVTMERQIEDELSRLEREIATWPEVMECYLMTGNSDYLLRVVTRDLASFEQFLKTRLTRMTGIANIRSSFALKQIVYRTELPIPPLA
jgi:DNA-binding Lrp family transcriptional regulator